MGQDASLTGGDTTVWWLTANGTWSPSQVFIEARFHSINTSPAQSEYLPLTIG